MKYPEELVNRYGAKAGILMYVAKHLPHIPQVNMIVKTPEENTDDFLKRADDAGILWPRLFRSSAVAELDGYEGDFPSVEIEGFDEANRKYARSGYCGSYSRRDLFDSHVRDTIEMIESSPQDLKPNPAHAHLPDKIAVIAAEKSPSSIVGTLVKHPNRHDGFYLVSATLASTADSGDAIRANYTFTQDQGIKPYSKYGNDLERPDYLSLKARQAMPSELEQVVRWHDAISSLPLMDPSWTYQIEFGLDPVCLYQVRPFKPVEMANFRLRPNEDSKFLTIIGTTPKKGLDLTVHAYDPDKDEPEQTIEPALFCGPLRSAWKTESLPAHKASILSRAIGFLAHSDVKAIRSGQVTVLSAGYYGMELKHGQRVNIVSDGKIAKIKPI